MITLTTEQAQQIEEALEDIVRVFKFETGTPVEALAVIRAARAQEQAEQEPLLWEDDKFAPHERPQKQEPVGVIKLWESETGFQNADYEFYRLPIGTHKLYAAPVRTKDLTDDEIAQVVGSPWWVKSYLTDFRAVIAADREKNK